jgi:hypothetical protein
MTESAYAHLGNALQVLLGILKRHDTQPMFAAVVHVDRDALQSVVNRIELARNVIHQSALTSTGGTHV